MIEDLKQAGQFLGRAMRSMVGIPEYNVYLDHMEKTHPDQPVMTYEEFFRDRQQARYGGKGSKVGCC